MNWDQRLKASSIVKLSKKVFFNLDVLIGLAIKASYIVISKGFFIQYYTRVVAVEITFFLTLTVYG